MKTEPNEHQIEAQNQQKTSKPYNKHLCFSEYTIKISALWITQNWEVYVNNADVGVQ